MKSNMKSGFTVVEAVVVMALIVAAIAIFSINQRKRSVTTEPTTTTAARQDETADWQTYTNSKYAFSFKYPKSWVKTENTGEGLVQLFSREAEGELVNTDPKNIVDAKEIIVFAKDSSSVDVKRDAASKPDLILLSSDDVMVDSITAKKFRYKFTADDTYMTIVYILKDKTYFIIYNYENSDQLDNILATFDFKN